ELGLLQVRHADHVHPPTAIQVRFRPGRKLWAFHAQIRSTVLTHDLGFLAGLAHNLRKLRTNGIGKRDVRYYAIAEKSVHAMARAVYELSHDQKLARLVLFFKRSDG